MRVKCFFSQLSSLSSALLGPGKPYPGAQHAASRSRLSLSKTSHTVGLQLISYLQKSNWFSYPWPTTAVQLLTKKRLILLSFILSYSTLRSILQPNVCIFGKSPFHDNTPPTQHWSISTIFDFHCCACLAFNSLRLPSRRPL